MGAESSSPRRPARARWTSNFIGDQTGSERRGSAASACADNERVRADIADALRPRICGEPRAAQGLCFGRAHQPEAAGNRARAGTMRKLESSARSAWRPRTSLLAKVAEARAATITRRRRPLRQHSGRCNSGKPQRRDAGSRDDVRWTITQDGCRERVRKKHGPARCGARLQAHSLR
jgi:hypothetical protein